MGRNRGGLVAAVRPGSLGEYLEIGPGDRIIAVNGRMLRDELDFRFYAAEESIVLDLEKKDGRKERYEIDKDPDDLLGISFQSPIFDRIMTCRNRCIFCFISQLPKGLRRSLYLRDDDYRLSFLFGNFISLTNLSEKDWERLREQRLSPLRVSVHSTDPDIRARLMGNPRASSVLHDLERLSDIGIRVHVQIVLLRGVNDGKRLAATLESLDSLGDAVVSVGVVPAVYTRYRRSLPSEPADAAWARETLDIIECYSSGAAKKRGTNWVYAADEFYVLADRPIPPISRYDDLPQYENGIGIISDFRTQLEAILAKFPASLAFPADNAPGKDLTGKVLAITGTMAYPEVLSAVKTLGLENVVSVLEVPNIFFGDTVTSAGLLTGQDILWAVLRFSRKGSRWRSVLVPSVAVTDGKFLDGMTVKGLSESLGIPVHVVEPTPESLIDGVFDKEG
ncbi:MAG TPA: DUF512 domain-containing protein [Firmicutes bacterium]|nr:DUF512 domain-containing protein [Candidatus Fermentithermobacillaceae bacterium]